MTALRTCRDCGVEAVRTEDLENFVAAPTSPYGRKNRCKPCMAKLLKQWVLDNPEKMRLGRRRWILKNRKKLAAESRAYYRKNKEKRAAYYRKNKEKRAAYAHAYYLAHRGKNVTPRRIGFHAPTNAPLCDSFTLSEPLTVEELVERSGAGRGYVMMALARYVASGVVQKLPDGRFRIDPDSPLRFAMDGYFASRTASKEEVKL